MAAQLKNILNFINIPVGGSQSLPHGLNNNFKKLVPDILTPNVDGATITADNTNVTVTNTTDLLLTISVLAEAWHTIERAFGPRAVTALTPQPFVVGTSGPANLIAASDILVWKPFGGVTADNVFVNWADLVAVSNTLQGLGERFIQFDPTTDGIGGTFTIPVAGTVQLAIPTTSTFKFSAGMVGRTIVIDGATTFGNDGAFVITAFIDSQTIQYTNAAGVAEAFTGQWIVIGGAGGTAMVIPPGVWNMTEREWTSFHTPNGVAPAITVSDGASFPGLRHITGAMTITNLSNSPNPPPIKFSSAAIFRFGAATTSFPQLVNSGTNPFWDLSALTGGAVIFRINGVIQGATPAFNLGNAPVNLSLTLYDTSRIFSGAIAGTNAAAQISYVAFPNASLMQQNTAAVPFAGTIFYGTQQNDIDPAGQWNRLIMTPASINQAAPPVVSVPFVFATGLGHSTNIHLTGIGATIAQGLPKIRSFTTNNVDARSDGAMNSTGIVIEIKHTGIGLGGVGINISPAAGETIDGGAGPLAVPDGGSRTLRSDGVSNWLVVGGYL